MAKKGPLKKILARAVFPPGFPHSHDLETTCKIPYEVLECGHIQLPVSDIYGETNAYRRRCRACQRKDLPHVDVSDYSHT